MKRVRVFRIESQAQQPHLRPAQLLQATGVIEPSQLGSEMDQAHPLPGGFGIIRSGTQLRV